MSSLSHKAAKASNPFASYEEWRASIPWTDEEICAALEQYLERLPVERGFEAFHVRRHLERLRRTGRLGAFTLRAVLPLLITTCAVCKRKAIYRHGCKGFCSYHRLYAVRLKEQDTRRMDRQIALRDAAFRAAQQQRLDGEQHRRARGSRKGVAR